MNISKKKLALIFIPVLALLSTVFAYVVLGYTFLGGTNFPFPDEIVVQGECGLSIQFGAAGGIGAGYVTLLDLATNPGILCCEQNNVEGIRDVEDLAGPNGSTVEGTMFKPSNATLDALFPEGPARGWEDYGVGDKIKITQAQWELIGEGEFTGKTLSYYSLVGGGAASPKEAYILSELGNLSPHVGIHYDIEDPTPVDPDSGYFNFNNRFELGEEEFFFGQYKWVEATGSGDALSGEPGPGGTYEWVKVRRVWGRNSGEVEYVSKTGVHYTWSEPISSDLYDSGVETLPGGSGKGIVPDNVVVHIEGEGYYKCRLITGGCSIQIAWWTTQAGGGGGYSGGNALAEEAQLFEDYIYDISGGELKRKTATWKDEEGNIHTDINAFDFEYNPSWVTGKVGEIDYDNITVRWEEDTQTAVIGPFAIDYYEAHAHVKDRNYVQFAGIFNMELYTDASEEPLKFGENNDWSFVWLEGNREKPGDLKFPKPNETFYVRMKYIEGATKITDFKVFFKYMNAAGSYAIYKGTYQIQIWERGKVQLHAQGDWVEATVDDNGVTIEEGHYDECQHWEFDMHLVTKEDELQAQKLAQGLYGARWYELCEITRSIDIYTGKLKIYKDIVDSEENVINEQDPNKWFHFTVSVQGAINSGEEWLEVRPGDSVESKVYYWVKGSDAPTFTVTESEDDEYTALYMECLSDGRKESGNTISGTLDSNKTITLRAVNFCERKARIEIEKKIKDNKEYLLDKEFKFDVTVKGDFVYDGKHYTEKQPLVLTDIIVTPKKSWISSEFLWYGAEEPTYEVVEKDVVPGAQIVSITGDGKGKLVNGLTTPITITAENELIREKGLIRIIKTLKYAELYDEDEIMKLKFNFIVKVDRYKDMYISIPAIREGNTYVWRATIGYYEWDYGNNPHYSIEEVDNPEGTTFDSASASEGIMTANENHIAVVDNYVINIIDRPNYGKIKITKKIDSEELKGKYFDFDLCITGAFEYNNKKYEEGTYRVSNIKWNETDGTYEILSPENIRFIKKESDENKDKDFIRIKVNSDETIWESKLFKWYGDTAPTYTIEEENQGTGIDYEVTPTQGELIGAKTEGTAGIVSILATNRFLPRKGQLQIIKKVINSEYLSPEYVKSLKFNFDVDVERFGHQTITLSNPVLEGNEWVWRSEVLDYSWLVDEGTPHYKVTEIAGTSGPQFDHADKQEGELIPNELGVIDFKTTEVSVYNKANPNTGKLKIDKKSADSSLDGKEFEFDVTISGTFIYDGTTYKNTSMKLEKQKASTTTPWVSKDITWYGEAPTYSVTELPSEYADLISVIGGSGVIVKDTEVTATFENKVKETGGYLQITKQINSGVQYKDEFKFEVRIAKAGEDINSVQPRIITLRANDTYRSEYIKWAVTEDAPTYMVREIDMPEGATLDSASTSNGSVSGDTVQGSLVSKDIVKVVYINKYESKEGKFKVVKQIIADKKFLDQLESTFGLRITVTGTFGMNGKEPEMDRTEVIETTLTVDLEKGTATYESPTFTWYGDNAPTVFVEETSMPKGWQFLGISNNGNRIRSEKDEELVITVTNKFDIYTVIDLTLQLAGRVWEDVPLNPEDKNTENSVPNGRIDADVEEGVDGVEVFVYDESGNLATIYDGIDNGIVKQPIITSDGGYWNAQRIVITPAFEKYDVVFVYDGQTYEPTKFLVTGNGDAQNYRNATTKGRDAYANDSMAIDINREEVNSRIAEVEGGTPIDGYGETIGTAVATDGTKNDLHYKSGKVTSLQEPTRRVSELQTKTSEGLVYDVFKAKAGTKAAGLTYPFDKKIHLVDYDTKITELGMVETYYYSATYNYCLHVNLGLVRREEADVSATKDLYEAKVIVNEKEADYRFNTLADIGKTSYERHAHSDSVNIDYRLGLYNTEYYYRAEMYQADYRAYDKIEGIYQSIDAFKETELEVYLTYRLTLYNDSPTYDVTINSVNDYFDSSFGKPIYEEVYKVIKDENDNRQKKLIAEPSGYALSNDQESINNLNPVDWAVTEKGISSSDGVTYNKMNTKSFKDIKLKSGERIIVFVTFKVEKDLINAVYDAVELGNKANIVEIASYSTYYTDGRLAGKVDRDSAPDNINIRSYNTKDWYEDDTDSAPVLKLTVEADTRAIDGSVWEDEDIDGNNRQKGILDEDEALIGGLTVELIQKIQTKDGTEYDFLWPTHKQLACLGGRTLEELTGFDSTTETGKDVDNLGKYSFIGIPVGKYVVRFLYGNDKLDLDDKFEITGDPEAMKAIGSRVVQYKESEDILTANYDNDLVGYTPAVYNGHDYKSAIYQRDNHNGLLTNKYHDLSSESIARTRLSDARDSEARRLELIAKTETIMNTLGEVLGTANNVNADHTELYDEFNMFADTAILDLSKLEESQYVGIETTSIESSTSGEGGVTVDFVNKEHKAYNIDFALVERPETAIVLDKQIKTISLITSDEKEIFTADYSVEYEVISGDVPQDRTIISKVNGGYLVAKVELTDKSVGTDVLQAINKVENKLTDTPNSGAQNFRFINVDDTILQGATVKINYLLTALNVSEADYTSETLAEIEDKEIAGLPRDASAKEKILQLAKEEAENSANVDGETRLGIYLGSNYYTGNVGNDSVVTTRVRQLVDYIDNDAVFTKDMNVEDNHMWRNTTITELRGDGYKAKALVNDRIMPEYRIIDKNGISYITPTKNNIVLSEDNLENADKSNAGFESKLVPYEIDSSKYKSQIELTISKTVSSEEDAKKLTFDNIAEIVKLENSVGRRDVAAITGNANPLGAMVDGEEQKGEFIGALPERDQSATELITFMPPTGIEAQVVLKAELLLMVAIALFVVITGIIIIKKKVLK